VEREKETMTAEISQQKELISKLQVFICLNSPEKSWSLLGNIITAQLSWFIGSDSENVSESIQPVSS